MSVKLNIKDPSLIYSSELAIGQYGQVSSCDKHNPGKVVLRTYNQVVLLDDPTQTWTLPTQSSPLCVRLPVGTTITITLDK